MFKHRPNGKDIIYDPNEIKPQWKRHYGLKWNIPSWFIAPMGKEWFYERLLLEVLIVMVKDKKNTA